MVCENCKENLDRIEQGYHSHDLPCSCSWKERILREIKEYILLAIILPLMFLIMIVSFPFFLKEKIVRWLEE